ncbi:hypothetical protein KP509_32G011800 [Ceratopteris richardii]|nr:hypothetical protein KP509_32G011800 [Ceratopteris richardii]
MAASGVSVSAMPSLLRTGNSDCKPARRACSLGRQMKNFTGMKSDSRVTRLGSGESTEEHFARAVLAQARVPAGSRGGALSSTCSLAAEIFRVVPIMSGLVLTGIALGFVLLRVEAAVEESNE